MLEQSKTEESLVHDVDCKVVHLRPAADKVFLAIFLQILAIMLIMSKAYSVLVCIYHFNVADCN